MSTSSPASSVTKLGDHLEQFQIQGDQLKMLELAATQIEDQQIRFGGVKSDDVRRNIIIPPLLRNLGIVIPPSQQKRKAREDLTMQIELNENTRLRKDYDSLSRKLTSLF
jgi:hypothetical protein